MSKTSDYAAADQLLAEELRKEEESLVDRVLMRHDTDLKEHLRRKIQGFEESLKGERVPGMAPESKRGLTGTTWRTKHGEKREIVIGKHRDGRVFPGSVRNLTNPGRTTLARWMSERTLRENYERVP